MNDKHTNTDLITRFLGGLLNADEHQDFDKKLQQDKELANDLAFVLATNRVLQQYSNEDVALFEKAAQKLRQTRIVRLILVGSASVAAAILGIWLYMSGLYLLNPIERKQEIAATVKQKEGNLRTAGGGSWQQDLLQTHYQDALPKLKAELDTYVDQSCPNEDLQFWYGLLLLFERKEPALAIPQFQCVLENKYEVETTAKYLILALLETKQDTRARQLLQQYPFVANKLPSKALKRLKN